MPDAPDPTPTSTLTLIRPDDWHVHLRDGAALAAQLAPHDACVNLSALEGLGARGRLGF